MYVYGHEQIPSSWSNQFLCMAVWSLFLLTAEVQLLLTWSGIVRNLLSHLFKTWSNNKTSILAFILLNTWNCRLGFFLLLLSHHCHWVTPFKGGTENRLHFFFFYCFTSCLRTCIYKLTFIKVQFQSSSYWCKFELSASLGPSHWFGACGYVVSCFSWVTFL